MGRPDGASAGGVSPHYMSCERGGKPPALAPRWAARAKSLWSDGMWPLLLLAVVAAATAYRVLAGYPRPPVSLAVLAPREYATIRAAALASYPPGGAIAPSGVEAGVPEYVDRFVAAQPKETRRLMRLLFLLVEQATLVFPAPGRGGFRRFSSLDEEQQVAYLRGWQRSRLLPRRLVFVSLRAILTMGYFGDPAVLRALGLAPRAITTPVCEADLLWPRVGEHPSTIRFRPEDVVPPPPAEPLGIGGALHPDYEAPGR